MKPGKCRLLVCHLEAMASMKHHMDEALVMAIQFNVILIKV